MSVPACPVVPPVVSPPVVPPVVVPAVPAVPPVVAFIKGYEAGAKSEKPNIEVLVNYISQPPDFTGFNDPAKGQGFAGSLFGLPVPALLPVDDAEAVQAVPQIARRRLRQGAAKRQRGLQALLRRSQTSSIVVDELFRRAVWREPVEGSLALRLWRLRRRPCMYRRRIGLSDVQ